MKRSLLRKLTALALTILLLAAFLPAATAADSRTAVTSVSVRLSDIYEIFEFGNTIEMPQLQVITTGYGIFAPSGDRSWYKYDEGSQSYRQVNSGCFGVGRWKYVMQLRIEGTEYKFAENVGVSVNFDDWDVTSVYSSSPDYSLIIVESPEFELENGNDELRVIVDDTFNIKTGIVGKEITPVSFAGAVSGGSGSYTYQKVSGPLWIDVDAGTGLITGRPTGSGENSDLTIKVTDTVREVSATAAVHVGKTKHQIVKVELTTNLSTVYEKGNAIVMPTVTCTDKRVTVVTSGATWWERMAENGAWLQVGSGTFDAYPYRFRQALLLTGTNGKHVSFAAEDELIVNVDGEPWTVLSSRSFDDFSDVIIESPIYHPRTTVSLHLPANLKVIRARAFEKNSFTGVRVRRQTTTIEKWAFRDCKNLRHIYIPESVTTIAEDAFEGVPFPLYFYVVYGSAAHLYAVNHHYPVIFTDR